VNLCDGLVVMDINRTGCCLTSVRSSPRLTGREQKPSIESEASTLGLSGSLN